MGGLGGNKSRPRAGLIHLPGQRDALVGGPVGAQAEGPAIGKLVLRRGGPGSRPRSTLKPIGVGRERGVLRKARRGCWHSRPCVKTGRGRRARGGMGRSRCGCGQAAVGLVGVGVGNAAPYGALITGGVAPIRKRMGVRVRGSRPA